MGVADLLNGRNDKSGINQKIVDNGDEDKQQSISDHTTPRHSEPTPIILGIKHASLTGEDVKNLFGE